MQLKGEPSAEDLKAGISAINDLYADYHDKRRAESQRVYGHPGASIATIPYPDTYACVKAVLKAVGKVA